MLYSYDNNNHNHMQAHTIISYAVEKMHNSQLSKVTSLVSSNLKTEVSFIINFAVRMMRSTLSSTNHYIGYTSHYYDDYM